MLGRELNFRAWRNPKRLFAELGFKAVFCLLNTEKINKAIQGKQLGKHVGD